MVLSQNILKLSKITHICDWFTTNWDYIFASLLAADTQFRAPLLWELLACTPNINKPRTKETEADYELDLEKEKFVKLIKFRKV